MRPADCKVSRFGNGHIHHTFLLTAPEGQFILQRINTNVFKEPDIIARNHRLAADYLAKHHPGYLFLTPISTVDGSDLFVHNDEYWRMLPFIANSTSVDQADTPEQAYEAARQFGRLARFLDGIDLKDFRPSIPDFHNLTLRYAAFREAVDTTAQARKQAAAALIGAYEQHAGIAATFELFKTAPDRLMHHDTKINNVLLAKDTFKGICVCDLDTLMPGKIISDIGDMVRTYVSPVSEEERDFSRIVIREEYYAALMKGYLSEAGSILTGIERDHLFYAGKFMIYMQGIRFLTDYLNGDVYYPVKYPTHNYDRAQNQLTLLERLLEKAEKLQQIIQEALLSV